MTWYPTTADLTRHLTAEYGEALAVSPDGSTAVVGAGLTQSDESRDVWIPCPGIGNLDATCWAEGWATWDEDAGHYVSDGGRVIGDTADMVADVVAEGDVGDELDELAAAYVRGGLK